MIRKRTVFILGAGISKPFGFPIGRDLVDDLSLQIRKRMPLYGMLSHIAKAETTARFGDALHGSNINSIDGLIERNPQYSLVGKCAIAAAIGSCEARIAEREKHPVGDWFGWIWNKFQGASIEDLATNQVAFITFNYDRLLEAFFYRQLQHTYPTASPDKRIQIGQILGESIFHIHGTIGVRRPAACWSSPDEPFEEAFSLSQFSIGRISKSGNWAADDNELAQRLLEMSENIRIIHEEVEGQTLNAAREKIAEAERIVFVGFGYEPRNIERLGVRDWVQKQIWHTEPQTVGEAVNYRLLGSAMHMKAAERRSAKALMNHNLFLDEQDHDAVSFSREYLVLD